MDEKRWNECEDPRKLLAWVRRVASDRKLRLFACSFWREWWQPSADEDSVRLVDYAERLAESGTWPDGGFPGGFGLKWHPLVAKDAFDSANWTIRETSGFKSRLDCMRHDPTARERAAAFQVRLLREVFGCPFPPVTLPASLLTPTVVQLAQVIYDGRHFGDMPILADALEEAGCDNQEVLTHCRSEGPHTRGCWVVDLVLRKE
jgi:hypothetical protein